MKTQTLLQALCAHIETWPVDVEYFNCDPDGEVRERGDTSHDGRSGTEYDFYPDVPVTFEERNESCGPGGYRVCKIEWLKAKGL